MDQEPSRVDETEIRSRKGIDGKLVLIVITLILFIVALYFEYQETNKSTDYDETLIEQPEAVISSPSPPKPVQRLQSNTDLAVQFYQATTRGDINALQNMVSQLSSREINTVTNGMTPIMKASSLGREDIVNFLLEHGADPNKRGSSQRTALQYAAERNRLGVAKLLIKNGADINGVDNTRLSPLIMAADRRYHDFAMYLIDAGADVNIQHTQGWTALIDASVSGDVKLVKRLLKEGADVTAKTKNGWTALDYAKHHKRFDVIPYLMEKQ